MWAPSLQIAVTLTILGALVSFIFFIATQPGNSNMEHVWNWALVGVCTMPCPFQWLLAVADVSAFGLRYSAPNLPRLRERDKYLDLQEVHALRDDSPATIKRQLPTRFGPRFPPSQLRSPLDPRPQRATRGLRPLRLGQPTPWPSSSSSDDTLSLWRCPSIRHVLAP